MRAIRYRPEVTADLVEAANWYDEKRRGLGDQFLEEYRVAIRQIIDRPESFAVTPTGLRACRMNRFAYVIHFDCDDLEIVVYAVMSGWRSSAAWLQRL